MILGGTATRAPQTPPGETAPGVPPTAVDETAVTPEQTGSRPAAPPLRCEKSDLLVDQCGCPECRPDLAEGPRVPDDLPIRYQGSWTEAAYAGVCGCGCETRYPEGAEIVCADVDHGARPRTRTWCLLEHTRDAVFEGGH